MLVAFRVEFGDDGKALAGLLSEVVGSIQTVKGCCTIKRASGVAVQVSPGDPVCQRDVIETAADGRIGICLLDGTVFDLFPGTRLALHEFVCDANGASHSLLVGVTGGTFAFMAGRVAETSRLTVDTPFGSIRGRAHSGGFGMLWLTALTLSMLGEGRAADPDTAILDDDRIAYKDLDFGVLELTTKEPIPKYILVEDPEKTIVLHQQERGSSVSVNQITNSAARMEELQAVQQEVLANFAKGPAGSSTPPGGSLSLQPINFIQTDAPLGYNSLPAQLFTPITIHEIILVRPPPTLSVPTGPIEIDTVVFDAFTARSGTFAASSIRSDVTLTFGVSGGTAGSTVLGGTTYDLSKIGTYGTFYVNSTTGAYTFVPDSGAINALKAPTTESFIITVSDGSLSVNQTFALTFNGTNDAAIISGTPTGSVIEAGGVANAATGTPTATGMLTDIDVDDPPDTFTAVSLPGGYGTFTMTAAGVWTYTLDNANSAVQALNVGGSLTDTFTVTTIDGTAKVVTITINGGNDAAIISGTTAGSVTEIRGVVNATPGTETATGTLTDTDLDNPPNTFTAVSLPGGYGTFTMTAAGVWTYTLDNTNSAVQALNVGDTRTDTFVVSSIDGTPQVVTITIHGPLIGATGTAPSLTLSESHLAATALDDNIAGSAPNATLTTTSGNFSTAFTSVQGVGGATISYALSIAGGNGTASGLIDSHAGQADVLVLNGNTIEGHVGSTGGALAFTIQLDPTTGLVTFTEYRAVTQPFGTNPDGGEGVSLTAGIVNLTATITETDGDFQTASIDLGRQLTIQDDGPTITASGSAPTPTVDESFLTAATNGINGSTPNLANTQTTGDFSTAFTPVQGADSATIAYALSITGGNGTASGLLDAQTGLSDVLVLNGNTIEGRVGHAAGALAFTITLDPNTGIVTFTEVRSVKEAMASNPDSSEGISLTAGIVNLTATITDKDGDFQTASIDLGRQLTIQDDGPTITASGSGPTLTVDESFLTAATNGINGSTPNLANTQTTGDFSTAFTPVQGADSATIAYALSITGGNGTASGLLDAQTGLSDVLVLNGNTIEGRVGHAAGALAFTITLDPNTGIVTFTEVRSVKEAMASKPDSSEGISLTAGIVNLTATITDKDGDFQTASIDLGKQLTIQDDGPTITASGSGPTLTVDESFLTAATNGINGSTPNLANTQTTGDFSTAFTSLQGADSATIAYALSITGGNGTASGLLDAQTGLSDVLVLNGNTIEGRVGHAAGALAFTITLDPNTGIVTFTEVRSVKEAMASNPDSSEGISLTAGIVNLTATITDKDGDFQTASVDLGKQLTIQDDGPTIGGFGEIGIVAQNNQSVTAFYNVSFGADGDGAMRIAIHDGAVNGFNLATTDLGGGITSVHVTGNGDDYTFYYRTHAVSGGVELDAFFINTSGTLSNAFFTLLINPDGTYTFDIESVGLLQQRTVSGSDFGASSSGQSSLTSPDGHLIITGDLNGAPADVKASSNGIAVGGTGLQMDQHETLLLKFTQEQTDVSFILTQWQGNGTADVVFKVYDGAIDIHDFNINIPKPSGDARIVVEKTSNLALVNTYTFDSATSTYTLYVGSEFDQIGVSYDQAVAGNTTFTINNITYDERTIPSTDLLFDVTAVDGDGDSSRASLQVHLLGGTSAESSLALSSTPSSDALVGDSGNATLTDPFMATTISGSPQAVTTTNAAAIISRSTTGFVLEAGGALPGTPTATGALTATDVDNPFNAFIPVSSPTPSASGYGSFTMTAVGMWIYMLDNANSAVENLNNGDTLTDSFTVTTVDGTPQVVSITIHGATDADINDFDALATRATVTTEPPFVYGTTGGDSIAGGGNDGQTVYGGAGGDTINGTGQEDLFAGSGNDTVKGNGGDDTIFGGSGIDTINGNNDDDTIVGGFGADNLTGSNGDDRFVYLSVADSNATRFDTITDFSSGSDRIDLTALGAFAFLALTSASTSVPPHTIAWIYDSGTNQTIVYVNPTDQSLSIGSSALLEIHLQGVVVVASTDFVFAAEAASASAAGEPINLELAATAETDGAVFAVTSADGIVDDADAKVQTSDVGFSLDADRDWPASGHARIVSFGEDRTQPTEANENNIVVTADNGQSVIPHHLHFAEPTELRFAFDPAPALNNTSAVTAHDAMMDQGGAIHACIPAPDAPDNIAELQPDLHGQGSEGGSGNAPPYSLGNNGSQVNSAVTPNEDNLGLPEVSVNHGQALASLAANSGAMPAHGSNNHSIPGDASEHGSNPSHGAPSNAHGMSGGGSNAPSHSHGNNGSQANSTFALNDDNSGLPEVSRNHGQAVASLATNSEEPPAHGNNNHSIPDDASEHGSNPSHGAPPSNGHGMSGAAGTPGPGDSFQFNHAMAGSESGSGNAPSHSHGNNGSQTNSTVTFNEDDLGVPEVLGNHGQAVASLVANSEQPPAHGNEHSIPGDANELGADPSHGAPSSNSHGLANSAAAGTPGLGDSFQFNQEIAGSVSSGIIELASLDPAPASTGRHANVAGNGQPGESQIIELSLPGNSADHFQGHPGNTYAQHDLMV